MSVYSLTRQNIHVLTASITGMSSLNSEGITVEMHGGSWVILGFVIWLSNIRLLAIPTQLVILACHGGIHLITHSFVIYTKSGLFKIF